MSINTSKISEDVVQVIYYQNNYQYCLYCLIKEFMQTIFLTKYFKCPKTIKYTTLCFKKTGPLFVFAITLLVVIRF